MKPFYILLPMPAPGIAPSCKPRVLTFFFEKKKASKEKAMEDRIEIIVMAQNT